MSRQISVAPTAAVDDPNVTDGMFRMLSLLGTYANRDGWCWPKLETLAKRRRMEKPAVSKILSRLREAGYLEVHYEIREGRRRCLFRVLFDRPVATAARITDDEYASGLEDSQSGTARVSAKETQATRRVSPTETRARLSVSPTETNGFPHGNGQFPPEGNGQFPPEGNGPLMNRPIEQTKGTSAAHAAALVVVDSWNTLAATTGLPRARLTSKRARLIATRLREPGWRADFEAACQFVAQTAWYRGANDRGWVATLDFLLQAGRATELAERASLPPKASGAATAPAPSAATLEPSALWEQLVRGGFTAPMQTRETLASRAEAAAWPGWTASQVLSLVLHVRPWDLAEIRFGKERDDRLAAALRTWSALPVEVAS